MRHAKAAVAAVFLFFSMAGYGRAQTVRIVAEDDWYPYSAKFDDGPRGIAVDLVRAAFAAEGVEVAYDVMNYDRGMQAVKDGEAIGCFDAPRTAEVENIYLWHEERLFAADMYFYVTADFQGTVRGVEDVAGKTVGLTQGYGYGTRVDMDTRMIKQYSKTDAILIQKLLAKRLDLIILYDKVADYLLPKQGASGKIKRVGPSDSIDIYVAFSRQHPEGQKYRDVFSEGFRKIKADGTYDRIGKEWDERLKSAPPGSG